MRRRRSVLQALAAALLALSALLPAPLAGQSAVYFFRAPDRVVRPGGPDIGVPIILDSSLGNALELATFGMCSDALVIVPIAVAEGADLAAIAGGSGPDFFAGTLTPPGGFTAAWIIDFTGIVVVPPTADFEMVLATYTPVGIDGESSPLQFCSNLGTPPVSIRVQEPGSPLLQVSVDSGSVLISHGHLALQLPPGLTVGVPFSATVTLHTPDPVSGFRFGLGHDPARVAPTSVLPSAALAAVNGGAGPDLFVADLSPAGGSGVTVQCELGAAPPFETLAAGLTEIAEIGFDAVGPAGGGCATATFSFRGDLGSPPVLLEVIEPGGGSLPATASDAETTIEANLPPHSGPVTLRIEDASGVPGSSASVRVQLDTAAPVQAFSFGVAHDSAEFVLASIEPGSALAGLTCNFGPDFFESAIPAGGTSGGNVVVLCDWTPVGNPKILPAGAGQEIVLLGYELPGFSTMPATAISFSDQVGAPAVAIEVTIDSLPVVPATIGGDLTIGAAFVRGACNDDAAVNIADAIHLLLHLFPPPGMPPAAIACADACDANDDGGLNIADAIALLDRLFGSGDPLPEPTACGVDPSADPLGCGASACP